MAAKSPVIISHRHTIPAGDYAVVASVERKTGDDFRSSLSDGSLAFLMAELATLPAAAVVVEDRYSSMLRSEYVEPGWLAELVARLQVRHPTVPVVFREARKYAEEWTYRFLGTAYAELGVPIRDGIADESE